MNSDTKNCLIEKTNNTVRQVLKKRRFLKDLSDSEKSVFNKKMFF